MPDEPSREPQESDEDLERRLRKLLGEGSLADSEEVAEIELKLRDLDDRIVAQRESRKEEGEAFDAQFDRRLSEIENRAKQAKKPVGGDARRYSGGGVSSTNQGLGLAFAVGYSFVGPIVAGIVIGMWIDGWRSGIGTLVGLGLGTAAAFFLLIRLVSRLNDSQR